MNASIPIAASDRILNTANWHSGPLAITIRPTVCHQRDCQKAVRTVTPPLQPLRVSDLWPGMVAAASFAICNVLSKLVLAAGSDVLTLSLFRGLVGVALLFIWLNAVSLPSPLTPRARLISLGLGLLFAGVVFGLFAAISIATVPIAVLTYFIYPLLTRIAGALLGIDKVGWRGALAAVVAFIGLALMIRAHPEQLAWSGLAFAIGAAVCRSAILLVTQSQLQDSDPQLTTWYLLLSSTAILATAALLTWKLARARYPIGVGSPHCHQRWNDDFCVGAVRIH